MYKINENDIEEIIKFVFKYQILGNELWGLDETDILEIENNIPNYIKALKTEKWLKLLNDCPRHQSNYDFTGILEYLLVMNTPEQLLSDNYTFNY